MEEREKRFAHLLQPIRDLAKNWDIDIAGQLEEYLSEVGSGATRARLTFHARMCVPRGGSLISAIVHVSADSCGE